MHASENFIPIVYFSIVFTGWKLFSAGSSESLVWSGLFLYSLVLDGSVFLQALQA